MEVTNDCISTSVEGMRIFAEEQSPGQNVDLVFRLPQELVAEIFVQTLSRGSFFVPPDINDSPWNLRAVCSLWRRIAPAERRLWNHVEVASIAAYIRTRSWTDVTSFQAYSRRFTIPFFGFLSQHIVHPNGLVSLKVGDLPFPKTWEAFIKDVVRPHLLRAHTLELCVEASHLSHIAPNACSQLESLTLGFKDDSELTVSDAATLPLFTGMRALRTLEISGIVIEQQLPDAVTTTIPWGQLTSLSITLCSSFAADLLSRCTNLLTCELFVEVFELGAAELAPVTAARLRCLIIENLTPERPLHALMDSFTPPSLSDLAVTASLAVAQTVTTTGQ
ncbi:hypothetical protein DXG03_005552 [Asterophora parasitica]|uniref:F-box domain-containing protein n=1 Tax=Asterophora parasitica TaxID=117018 RepID=A0A9P7G097_9AGAR|nr:hypothetical protein DXG03_005552 [Asterophora parasitica]